MTTNWSTYSEGYQAAAKNVYENPYDRGSQQHEDWKAGNDFKSSVEKIVQRPQDAACISCGSAVRNCIC